MRKFLVSFVVLYATQAAAQDAQNRAGQSESGVPRAAQQQSDRQQAGRPQNGLRAGQSATSRNQAGQPLASSQQNQGGNLDQQIALCLLLGNEEEIALAQFAKERAQNDEVKKFAEMMIEQHQQAIAKIQTAVPQPAGNVQLQGAESDTATAGAQQPPNSATTAPQHSMAALAKQVKQECLKLTQRELGEYQGAEFDNAYIGQQIGAHIGMLAQLNGSANFASAQLKTVIQEGQKMTEEHLGHAKELMKKINDKGQSTAQKDGRAKKTARQ